MDDRDFVALANQRGFTLGNVAVYEKPNGRYLIEVNDIEMFLEDAEDLICGRATILQITKRNQNKIFPDAMKWSV